MTTNTALWKIFNVLSSSFSGRQLGQSEDLHQIILIIWSFDHLIIWTFLPCRTDTDKLSRRSRCVGDRIIYESINRLGSIINCLCLFIMYVTCWLGGLPPTAAASVCKETPAVWWKIQDAAGQFTQRSNVNSVYWSFAKYFWSSKIWEYLITFATITCFLFDQDDDNNQTYSQCST